MKFDAGKIYTKRSAQDVNKPCGGIIARYVLSDGEMTQYILVSIDPEHSSGYEQTFPSSCRDSSFRAWAELEVPMTPFIQKQVNEYHQGRREFSKIIETALADSALLSASNESLLSEVERRKQAGLL